MGETPRAPRLLTTGRIANELGVPLHRVTYILATRPILPTAFAGVLRLYDRSDVARIRHELNAIDARRASGLALPGGEPT